MSKIAELYAKRSENIAVIKSLLDSAEGSQRDLSPSERSEKDRLFNEIERIDQRIADEDRVSALLKQERDENSPLPVRVEVTHGGNDSVMSSGTPTGPSFRDLVSGQIYRSARPGERLGAARSDLSIGRLFRGALLGRWDNAEAELRAFGSNVGSEGGFLIPQQLSEMFVDASRNKSRCVQAGALSINVASPNCVIARLEEDANASYKQENAAATDATMKFGQISLQSRTLVCYATFSREVLEDAQNLDMIVEGAISEAVAREIDRAALFGTGVSGQPLGLYEYSSTQTNHVLPNVNGFSIADYDEFSSAIKLIEEQNGEALAAIYSPRTGDSLRTLKETGTAAYMQAPEFFTNLKRLTTNQIPNDLVVGSSTDCSAIFIGDWSQMLFAIRQGLRIETTSVGDGAWERYQYKVRCTARFDVTLLRPKHFSIVRGVRV